MMQQTFINRETGTEPDIAEGIYISGIVDCIHKITIEKDAFFGHEVMLLTGGHNWRKFGEDRKREGAGGPITIHEGAWVGSGAIIIGPCEIGKHAVVGAGSVVRKNIPEYTMVLGNPAQEVKAIPHD